MTTFTSTATASLTPSQQAAREFWRQAGADGMPPFYVMSQYYAQLSANSDNLPVVTAALEQLLTGLGYETDIDTVLSELTAGQGEELGYWAGRYCLFDSDGNRFDLVVGRDGATLTVPPALVDVTKLPAGADMASVTVLSGTSFNDGVLQLANAQFRASLSFALPVSDADFDSPDPVTTMFQSTAPGCTGTFAAVGDGAAGLRPVTGKRGAWTQAGVNQTADGDPASAWYGQYVLLDVTDLTAVQQQTDRVYIYNDPQFGLTFQWGDGNNAKYGGNVTYNNNVLQCPDEDDDTINYAMQFTALQAGAAEINLAVVTAGVVRSYKGYWVDRYTPPHPSPSLALQARLAKRPMMAVYRAGADDVSGSGYSQAIDISSLTPDPAKPNKIVLPYAAVGNTYALSLNLTGSAPTDKFSWALKPGGGSNDATSRAVITQNSATTAQFTLANLSNSDAGRQLLVTVELTNNSPATPVTYTLQLDIVVIQCDPISLAPIVLMPVTVGAAYTQNLVAHGARSNFTWSVTPSLPSGLSWDDNNRQLSGTVTDSTQVGKAFSLVVELTASDVIMDALTASLGITVQAAPVVASGMPPWERILLYAAGPSLVTMTAIIAFAIHRIKTTQTKAKAEDAAKEGNTNIETATNGDPKSVSKSIVQSDDDTLPIIKGNIPNRQSLLNDINQQVKESSAQIAKNEATIEKLSKYVEQHKRDNWDDEVTDEELAEDYPTFGEAIDGLKKLKESNNSQIEETSMIMERSNREVTNTASEQTEISESDEMQPYKKNLVEE